MNSYAENAREIGRKAIDRDDGTTEVSLIIVGLPSTHDWRWQQPDS